MRSLSMVFLGSVLLFASMTLFSPVSHALPSGTSCLPGGLTPQGTGSGSTCEAAQADLYSSLLPYVSCPEGSCGINVVYETECRPAKNGFVSRGSLYYRCWTTISDPIP